MDVSIIVPVYNDPKGIDMTLNSIVKQKYDEYEIIPVDNSSTDDTPKVIRKWAQKHPSLVYPTTEHQIQSSYAARNSGIKKARGDILVFIDSDMKAPDSWIHKISESFFTETNVDYLGYEVCIYTPEGEENIWSWYDEITGLPSRYYFNNKNFVPTSCLAVRRGVFKKVGLFEERLASGGDKEFGLRVHRHSDLRMAFKDDVIVFHPARTSFREHRKKQMRIGHGLAKLYDISKPNHDANAALYELLLHFIPPTPFRIYMKYGFYSPSYFFLLYSIHVLMRYIRLIGGISYFLDN